MGDSKLKKKTCKKIRTRALTLYQDVYFCFRYVQNSEKKSIDLIWIKISFKHWNKMKNKNMWIIIVQLQ